MSNELEKNSEILLKGSGTLIIVRGIVGAGKSFLSTGLSEKLGEATVRIDPDEYKFRHDLLLGDPDNSNKTEIGETFGFLKQHALTSLREGNIVIWDQAWTGLKEPREVLEEIERAIFPARVLLVEVELESSKAWERIQQRTGDRKLSREKFLDYIQRFRSVQEDDRDDRFILVSGDRNIEENIYLILERMGKLGIPVPKQ